MKRLKIIIPVVIAIVVIIVGIVFFTRKDNGQVKTKISKEEMLNQAIELDYTTINNEKFDNIARATEKYVGKIFTYTATVTDISTDHCFIFEELPNGRHIKPVEVYLSTEDLTKISKGDNITIVGKLDKLDMGMNLTIKQAYLISVNK